MNLILIFIAVSAITFTVVMIRLFVDTGMIPDTLCTCVFSMLGGECGFMAVIKSFKEKNRDRKIELEDREYYESKNRQNDDAGCTPNQETEGM